MKINIQVNGIKDLLKDTYILGIFEDEVKLGRNAKIIDKNLDGQISKLIKDELVLGKKGEITSLFGTAKAKIQNVLVIGLGKRKDFSYEILRMQAGNISRALKKIKATSLIWNLEEEVNLDKVLLAQAIIEGLNLGLYEFKEFKTQLKQKKKISEYALDKVTIIFNDGDESLIKKGAEKGLIMAQGVAIARDLANTPANYLTPEIFVKKAKELFKRKMNISIDVIDAKQAKKLGMEAFLGVAKGSKHEPYLLQISYKGAKAKDKAIALVGKGVMFDSGGISLKPSTNMHEMKGDMSGAGAVLASMFILSQLKPKKNVFAFMPLVENMPAGDAQKPGDVVKAMNGKFIEIINTDAEGRLILADALCLAVSKNISEVIDIATLTGACSVALGSVASAILGNNQKLLDKMKKIAELTGERVWQLPLYEEYIDLLKSDVADIANCATKRDAGTASAAKFLEQFVDDKPWLHIDIASVMDYEATTGYKVKGMSGSGVRNLVEYVLV